MAGLIAILTGLLIYTVLKYIERQVRTKRWRSAMASFFYFRENNIVCNGNNNKFCSKKEKKV